MASIRKRGSSYHAQVRKIGFPAITKSFKNLALAKQWARNTESDLERHLCEGVIPSPHRHRPDIGTQRPLRDRIRCQSKDCYL